MLVVSLSSLGVRDFVHDANGYAIREKGRTSDHRPMERVL
jgi:hypothetical protein